MKLNSSSISFGRHESFPLRFGWLTKGLTAVQNNPKVFESDDATITLGVGKNMVSAIRYWLQATQIMQRNPENVLEPTPVGEVIFASNGDPYLEDEGTIWLLHWLLATNPTKATAIYWFFNHFHKPEFTREEVASGLRDFVKQNIETKVATSTLNSDAALLLRMYVRTTGDSRVTLEDALNSPLSNLQLQERKGFKTFRSFPAERTELPLGIFAFAVGQLYEHVGRRQISIEQFMYSSHEHCAPGAVFRMTEDNLLGKLEELCVCFPDTYRIDQTAGLHQLYQFGEFHPRAALEQYYTEMLGDIAV